MRLVKEKPWITKEPIEGLTKEEWLEKRKGSIGGSEIGAIMGMSPYASAYSVYCERKGLWPAFEGNLATEVGTMLEEFVARKFATLIGLTVNRTNFIWKNEHHPHLHASPDRLIIGDKRKPMAGLECKTTGEYSAAKVHGCDFPLIYYSQCVQYMMVTELPVWYLAVLVGNREFHIFGLSVNNAVEKPDWCESMVYVPQSDMDALQDAANEFWQQLETDTPPAPDGSKATGDAMKIVYADTKEGNADLWGRETLLEQYMDEKAQADKHDKEAQRLAQMIQVEMNGCETGECLGYKVKWKMQPGRASFDYKACVAANPDMGIYLKQGAPFRKFEVKKV